MSDRVAVAEYKHFIAQMSVAPRGRVVQVSAPSPVLAAALAKASGVLAKPNKYGAKKRIVDGVTFASKLEARVYVQLLEMQRQGLIYGLVRKVRYPPKVDGVKIGAYIADFVYTNAVGAEVIEDSKGVLTPLYRRSNKHFQSQYGKTIVEVTK